MANLTSQDLPTRLAQALANGYADSRDDAARAHMNKAHKQIDAHDGAIYIDPIFGAFCYGADWSHASLAPLHRVLVEIAAAAQSVSSCDSEYQGAKQEGASWTDFYDYWRKESASRRERLRLALASLENAIKESGK